LSIFYNTDTKIFRIFAGLDFENAAVCEDETGKNKIA
jgi:hypothetical protein